MSVEFEPPRDEKYVRKKTKNYPNGRCRCPRSSSPLRDEEYDRTKMRTKQLTQRRDRRDASHSQPKRELGKGSRRKERGQIHTTEPSEYLLARVRVWMAMCIPQ